MGSELDAAYDTEAKREHLRRAGRRLANGMRLMGFAAAVVVIGDCCILVTNLSQASAGLFLTLSVVTSAFIFGAFFMFRGATFVAALTDLLSSPSPHGRESPPLNASNGEESH